jgi:hypothetical protein
MKHFIYLLAVFNNAGEINIIKQYPVMWYC